MQGYINLTVEDHDDVDCIAVETRLEDVSEFNKLLLLNAFVEVLELKPQDVMLYGCMSETGIFDHFSKCVDSNEYNAYINGRCSHEG